MTCKRCIHFDTCLKDNKTRYYGDTIATNNVEELCKWFIIKQATGMWTPYSTTMMECSICGRHVARHRYEFCPHCGSKMFPKIHIKKDIQNNFEQLTFDLVLQQGDRLHGV